MRPIKRKGKGDLSDENPPTHSHAHLTVWQEKLPKDNVASMEEKE